MLNEWVFAGVGGNSPRKLTAKEIGDSKYLRFLAENDPEAAAIIHMDVMAEVFLKAPMSSPIAHITSSKVNWVMQGGEGWNMLKTAHWARAYAERLDADRVDIMQAMNLPPLAISMDTRHKIPCLVTMCEMRERVRPYVCAREIIGDERRRDVKDLRPNPMVDLSPVWGVFTGILVHKTPLPDNDDGEMIIIDHAAA